MADDGAPLQEWVAAQAAPIASLLRPPAHNTLMPVLETRDSTHFRYWTRWANAGASESLARWEDEHHTTPDQTGVMSFGRGWAALVAEMRRRAPDAAIVPIMYLYFEPRISNNPALAGKEQTLHHWWHPDLVYEMLRPLFAAGMDAVTPWTYWGGVAKIESWTYLTYLQFKHHFVADGLEGSLPCDARVFAGWVGNDGVLPSGWYAGVDWSKVTPRPGNRTAGFYGFADHVDWRAVGTDASLLPAQVIRAFQEYYYDAYAAIRRASLARPRN